MYSSGNFSSDSPTFWSIFTLDFAICSLQPLSVFRVPHNQMYGFYFVFSFSK